MLAIGQFNQLKVTSETEAGVFLDAGEHGEILLPRRIAPLNTEPDQHLEVFVYADSEDRLVATTETPLVCAGEFGWLKVVAVSNVGAFLDWGLPKDLLLPFGEQKYPPEVGRRVMVKVYVDKHSDRLVASTRIDGFLQEQAEGFKAGQAVDLLIADKTELGYKAIVDNSHWGVLYRSELYQPVAKGQRIKGFIKRIRPDKKIDLTLSQPGYEQVSGIAEKIIDTLKEHDGFLMITDKSSPETIASVFKVSKKVYKKAIGALYKQRRIIIEDKGVRLVED